MFFCICICVRAAVCLIFAVQIIESADGGGVAVDVEVNDVGLLHVVAPLEFKAQRRQHAKRGAGNSDGQRFTVHGDLCIRHLFPGKAPRVNRAHVSLDRGLAVYGCGTVDDEVVTLPAVGLDAVGIDKERHPAAFDRGGDVVCAFHVEVNIVRITRNLGGNDVVSAREVLVVRACKSVVVAVYGGTLVAHVARRDVIPLCSRAVHDDGLGSGQLLTLGRALEAADVGAEL